MFNWGGWRKEAGEEIRRAKRAREEERRGERAVLETPPVKIIVPGRERWER